MVTSAESSPKKQNGNYKRKKTSSTLRKLFEEKNLPEEVEIVPGEGESLQDEQESLRYVVVLIN